MTLLKFYTITLNRLKPLENIFSELSSINMSENFGDDYSIIELEVNHN
jgi:hypothetical protein